MLIFIFNINLFNLACLFGKSWNIHLQIDRIRNRYSGLHCKNYLETFPKFSDSKIKFCFRYTSINLGIWLVSEISGDIGTFSGIAGNSKEVILYFSKSSCYIEENVFFVTEYVCKHGHIYTFMKIRYINWIKSKKHWIVKTNVKYNCNALVNLHLFIEYFFWFRRESVYLF